MKLNEVIIANEDGEEGKLARADYLKHVLKTHDVQAFESEEHGTTPADKVVGHILKSLESGKDIDDAIQGEYAELVTAMTEDYNRSAKSKDDKKKEAEEAKAKKEAEKKAREEEEAKKKAALVITQNEFAISAAEGAKLAADEFKTELETLASHLPEGVTVKSTGAGYGLEFGEGVDKNTIGNVLGYLLQKDNNSEFIGNQLTFWIGDTILKTVAMGIYATAKEAAKHIAEVWSEKSGKTIQAPSLDQYKRMSERTPIEYRNPKADPTAYLAISAAKAPRKDEKESDKSYEKRLSAFNKDREELQKKLAVGEVVKRKDMVPLVNDLLVKHGMKEAVDPNAPVISISQQLQIFFHGTLALEEFLSVHKEGVITYKDGGDIIEVTKEEMEEKVASAKANLVNALYSSEKTGLTILDYSRGFVTKKAMIEVAKDGDGKAIKEEQNVKSMVYPAPFFEVEKPEPAKEEAAK